MMEIKNEVLNISEDESESFNDIYRNNPVETTDANIGCAQNIETNDSNIYTPLKSVDFERFKKPKKLSTSPIKSPTEHTVIDCSRSGGGCKSLSPRKLGVKTFDRARYDKLRSPNKLQDEDVNQKNQTVDDDEEVGENTKCMEYSKTVIPDINILKQPNGNQHDNQHESDDDIFASQELDNCNRIINNIDVGNNSQQMTPSKVKREKSKNSPIKNEKLFLTPQSVGNSTMSSDSEFERVCSSIKNNNFDPGHYSFETMDLLNQFEDIDDVASDKILSDMLGLSVNNEENNHEPLADPLAATPQRVSDPKQDDDKSSPKKQTRKRKLFNEIKRRSTRLQAKLNKTIENDSSSTDEDLRKVREKIKLVEEKEAISPETMEKLKNLDIKLESEPRPQHQLENYISRPPSLDIKKSFVQYGPLKKGYYSEAEDKIIKKNWKQFCLTHNWDPHNVKPFMNVRIRRRPIISKEQRIKFVQFLAQGLPWRLLYSVYSRFQLIYTKRKHERKYTPEDDEQIMIYMENETRYSHKCLQLAQLLNRTRTSIRERYAYLKNRKQKSKEKTKIKWDVPLIENFLKQLLKVTLSKNIYELKDAVIPKVVWIKLEKRMKIPHDTLMLFWLQRLHAQLFCTKPIYEIDIKIMLIEYLYVKGISNREELIWPSIAKHFDGLTPHYLSQMFYSLVKCTPLKRKKHLAGIIGWLYEKRIPQLASKIKDRYLPRLIYKNGKIEIINEFSSSSSSSLSSFSSSSSLDFSESD